MAFIFRETQTKRRIRWNKQAAKRTLIRSKQMRHKKKLQHLIGKNAIELGAQQTAEIFEVSPSVAAYWGKKRVDPTFHSNSHGGSRYFQKYYILFISFRRRKFSTLEEKLAFEAILWRLVQIHPCWSPAAYAARLRTKWGFDSVFEHFVRQTFKRWHFTPKVPTRRQLQKYSPQNLLHYVRHVVGILKVIMVFIANQMRYLWRNCIILMKHTMFQKICKVDGDGMKKENRWWYLQTQNWMRIIHSRS